MTPADIYAYAEALLRVARTLAASYAAHLCFNSQLTKREKAARLSTLRADVADIPEVAEVVDSIVCAHARELLEGDPPLYRLTS